MTVVCGRRVGKRREKKVYGLHCVGKLSVCGWSWSNTFGRESRTKGGVCSEGTVRFG